MPTNRPEGKGTARPSESSRNNLQLRSKSILSQTANGTFEKIAITTMLFYLIIGVFSKENLFKITPPNKVSDQNNFVIGH